jgi:hypothetical protein
MRANICLATDLCSTSRTYLQTRTDGLLTRWLRSWRNRWRWWCCHWRLGRAATNRNFNRLFARRALNQLAGQLVRRVKWLSAFRTFKVDVGHRVCGSRLTIEFSVTPPTGRACNRGVTGVYAATTGSLLPTRRVRILPMPGTDRAFTCCPAVNLPRRFHAIRSTGRAYA